MRIRLTYSPSYMPVERLKRVIVRALDQVGNVLPFLADMVRIAVEGPARLIGPASTPLGGGTTGFWVRATGEPCAVRLTLTSDRLPPATLVLTAE